MTITSSRLSPAPATRAPAAGFPYGLHPSASAYHAAYATELAAALASVDPGELDRAGQVLLGTYLRGAAAFSCGNGGSASISDHLQCDHMKGARNGTDLLPRVVSLSSNVAVITAVTNDLGYDEVYRFQLESQARPGDVLVAISSSGRSTNIVRAIEWAAEHDVATIAMTGFEGGGARRAADVALHVDSYNYGVVEDAHQALMHCLAQYVRQSRMAEATIAETTF